MNHRQPHIVVFYGGSSNQDLSRETGEWFCQYVPRSKYQVTPVEIMSDGSWKVPLGSLPRTGPVKRVMEMLSKAIRPLAPSKALERLLNRPIDAMMTLVRGQGGDDGSMHSLGQTLSIPVIGSSASTCHQTSNKHACEHLVQEIVPMPYTRHFKNSMSVEDILEAARHHFVPPLFVKPASEEGSMGVEEVHSIDELSMAIRHAHRRGDILLQNRAHGTELSVTLMQDKKGKIQVLPPTIIVPKKSSFFDHISKRRPGRVALHTPNTVDNPIINEATTIARDVYEQLGCAGMVSIDMIADNKSVDLLEVNTIPTFTDLTPLKQQFKTAGIHPATVFDNLIEYNLQR